MFIDSNDFLINLCVDEEIVPAYIDANSVDLRRLGIAIYDLKIIDSDITKQLQNIKVDRFKTEYLINWLYDNRIYNEMDFKFFENFSEIEKGVFLDIGANIGQSAISFSLANHKMKIISFEPDKLLENNLETIKLLLVGRHNYHLYGIAETTEKLNFYVPKIKERYFTEEGTFDKKEFDGDMFKQRMASVRQDYESEISFEEFTFETRNLLDWDMESYFIKIDTQGFELKSIKGIINIISKYRPIIIVERSGEFSATMEIVHYMEEYEYELYFYDFFSNKLTRKVTNTPNYFLIPKRLTKNDEINGILVGLVDI